MILPDSCPIVTFELDGGCTGGRGVNNIAPNPPVLWVEFEASCDDPRGSGGPPERVPKPFLGSVKGPSVEFRVVWAPEP